MGLGFNNLLYAKMDSGDMQGWNLTLHAEDSGIAATTLGNPDISPPTTMSQFEVAAIPYIGTGPLQALLLTYQTEGNDLTMSTGYISTGVWYSTKIPIPDD